LGGLLLLLLPAQVDLFAGIARGRNQEPGIGRYRKAPGVSGGIGDLVFEVSHPAERHARCPLPVVAAEGLYLLKIGSEGVCVVQETRMKYLLTNKNTIK